MTGIREGSGSGPEGKSRCGAVVAKVRSTESVRDVAGSVYPEGREVDAFFALGGVPEVVGAGYLSLSRDEWEPVISEEDLRRLLGER